MIISIPDELITRWTYCMREDGYCVPKTAEEWSKLTITILHPEITHGEEPDVDYMFNPFPEIPIEK